MTAYAIILAGGNGERFWPLSTPEKPKQFLSLFGGKPLIRQAVDRLDGLIALDHIFVITAERLVAQTREALPMLSADHIVGEPCRRDTAPAVATACGLVQKYGGADAVGCILTADHLIAPVVTFQQTLADAIQVAYETDAIVTMGIKPRSPETGYGYIACADEVKVEGSVSLHTRFLKVTQFVEKPNRETAQYYLEAGNYLWNAGMFVWKARSMRTAFEVGAPDIAPLIDAVAQAEDVGEVLAQQYISLRSISVDFAVMEHAPAILVAESVFNWDDVGSWMAVDKHFPQDEMANAVVGSADLRGVLQSVVVNQNEDHKLVVMGLQDVVVVHTDKATLVCSKASLPLLKKIRN